MSDTDLAETPGAEAFARYPRPLSFIRIRLYRGGQAEFIRDLFEDEKDRLFKDLGDMRSEGKDESNPEVEECKTNLRHLIYALKDLNNGMIELAGPDGL